VELTPRKLLRLLVVVACVAALGWTIAALGPRRVLGTALDADPWWLALSALPVVGRFLIWAFKWTRMLARESRVPYVPALRILAAGSFANLVTPTAKLAGGVVRAALLHRRFGWRMSTAYGWAMADQVTNVLGNVTLYGVLAVAVGSSALGGDLRRAFLASGLAVLTGLVAFLTLRPWMWRTVADPRVGKRLARLVPSRMRGDDDGRATADRVRRILEPLLGRGPWWRTTLPDIGGAALAFVSVCLANAMVLRALGVEAPILVVSIAVVLAYFAGVLVGFGGLGVTEAALTALWIQLGIPPESAAAAALLHRAIFYAVVVLLGVGAF